MAPTGNESKVATRQKTFLKGVLYYDNQRASIDCVIRDISETGARLSFEHPATIPDNVELFIPNKQQTFRAIVRRRAPCEVGIAFEVERSLEARRAVDSDLQQRVEALETEITALKRLVGKLKAKVMPHDLDAA